MSEAKSTDPLSSRNPAGPCRHAALAVRRDVRGAVPDPGLRLRQRRAVRGALQGRGSRLHLFALLQSRRSRCSSSACRARRRRSRARDRDRHGGGDHGDARAAAAPAITWSRRRRCSARAATWSRICCRATASSRRWSTASTSTSGRRRCGRTPRRVFLESPTNPTLDVRRHPRGRRDRAHAGGARLIVDNVFATPIWQSPLDARRRRRRLFGDQAHRRPGPLPRRHDPVARKTSSPSTSTISCARPARRCPRSTPGCC